MCNVLGNIDLVGGVKANRILNGYSHRERTPDGKLVHTKRGKCTFNIKRSFFIFGKLGSRYNVGIVIELLESRCVFTDECV